MTIAFISDLHLSAERPSGISRFNDFMEKSGQLLESIYILGDLFDYWIGDDGSAALGFGAVEDALKKTSDAGTQLFFIPGNRDFLIGSEFAERTGITLLDDKTILELFGQRVMIAHGDQFCIDDQAYMAAREQFMNSVWQREKLATSIESRIEEARQLRQQSEQEKSNKPEEIMDVNQDEIVRTFRENNLDRLIHGHTHRPYIHEIDVDGKACRRYVLGQWENSRSVLYANQGKYYLKK